MYYMHNLIASEAKLRAQARSPAVALNILHSTSVMQNAMIHDLPDLPVLRALRYAAIVTPMQCTPEN